MARVKGLFGRDPSLVLGGFHLAGFENREIKEIIRGFRDSGVRRVGPDHCSGDEARALFAEEHKEDFVEIGVGKKITVR